MTPGEIQKLFDAYLIMEAQQALQLSETAVSAVSFAAAALQETRRKNHRNAIN
jgi:hypothetical protein